MATDFRIAKIAKIAKIEKTRAGLVPRAGSMRALNNSFVTRCLEKLEFYAAIDFFLNDTAWHARHRAAWEPSRGR